jgi:hypothetical protein
MCGVAGAAAAPGSAQRGTFAAHRLAPRRETLARGIVWLAKPGLLTVTPPPTDKEAPP